jgi:hypothetical protein
MSSRRLKSLRARLGLALTALVVWAVALAAIIDLDKAASSW